MNTVLKALGVCLTGEHALELDAFAAACGTPAEFVCLLVDEGLLQPVARQPGLQPVLQPVLQPFLQTDWRFGGEELARVRRICRLQRDFEANLQSVAVMLDLIDEIEGLRAQLRRAGITAR